MLGLGLLVAGMASPTTTNTTDAVRKQLESQLRSKLGGLLPPAPPRAVNGDGLTALRSKLRADVERVEREAAEVGNADDTEEAQMRERVRLLERTVQEREGALRSAWPRIQSLQAQLAAQSDETASLRNLNTRLKQRLGTLKGSLQTPLSPEAMSADLQRPD